MSLVTDQWLSTAEHRQNRRPVTMTCPLSCPATATAPPASPLCVVEILCLALSVAPLIRLTTRRGPVPRVARSLGQLSHTGVKERSRRAVLERGRRVEVLKISAAGGTRRGYSTSHRGFAETVEGELAALQLPCVSSYP